MFQLALSYHHSTLFWLTLTSDDIKEHIYKLAKKDPTSSQTGMILRDSHVVTQVCLVTANKILRILTSKDLAPDLPDNHYHLIEKVFSVCKCLERSRKDKDAKFCLILRESNKITLNKKFKIT